jgi:hypothetical protein
MKLVQSALWLAMTGEGKRVPVTALAQLSALHWSLSLSQRSTMPLRAVPTRARRINAVFMIKDKVKMLRLSV